PTFLARQRRRCLESPPWTSIANARHADAPIGRPAGPRQVPGCGGTQTLSWWPRLRRERRPTEQRDPRSKLSCRRARPSGAPLTTGPQRERRGPREERRLPSGGPGASAFPPGSPRPAIGDAHAAPSSACSVASRASSSNRRSS
ncbi:unnamed protein product, partial [Ixodes hexagonus]